MLKGEKKNHNALGEVVFLVNVVIKMGVFCVR